MLLFALQILSSPTSKALTMRSFDARCLTCPRGYHEPSCTSVWLFLTLWRDCWRRWRLQNDQSHKHYLPKLSVIVHQSDCLLYSAALGMWKDNYVVQYGTLILPILHTHRLSEIKILIMLKLKEKLSGISEVKSVNIMSYTYQGKFQISASAIGSVPVNLFPGWDLLLQTLQISLISQAVERQV